MDSTPPEVASYDAELQHQLQVLRSVAGASSVKDYPPGRLTSYNQAGGGACCKGESQEPGRRRSDGGSGSCSRRPQSWRRAAPAAHRHEACRDEAVAEEEEEWLASWYAGQEEPDKVTCQMANAALAAHRQARDGRATTKKLFEAQWLRVGTTCAMMCGRMQRLLATPELGLVFGVSDSTSSADLEWTQPPSHAASLDVRSPSLAYYVVCDGDLGAL
mmetsp:Transcript_4057/g.8500  ORF Transcript_4057/g.8500 Transcript_4057/m.8500 type:complete len:217 (-) Transcript_4057:238-888(-)